MEKRKSEPRETSKGLPPEREDGKGFERMSDFARRVVAVPKEKIDERERAYRAGKDRKAPS